MDAMENSVSNEGSDPGTAEQVPCEVEFDGELLNADGILTGVTKDGKTKRPHPCPQCGKAFQHRYYLQNHMAVHSEERPFPCTFCEKRFKLSGNLFTHMRLHSGEEKCQVTCPVCSKAFYLKSALEIHMKKHSTERRYGCPICDQRFTHASGLSSHLRQRHPSVHICSVCGRRFNHKCLLEKHMAIHATERNFKCSHCDKFYKNMMHLKSHIKTTHVESRPVLPCPICSKVFRWRSSLNLHMKRHSGERPYKCPLCDKRFISGTVLKRHMLTHNRLEGKRHVDEREKRHVCAVCDKAFQTKYQLNQHRVVHSEDRLKCLDCGKEFRHRSTLLGHRRLHRNPYPFNCKLCSRRFKTRAALKKHETGHDLEKKLGFSLGSSLLCDAKTNLPEATVTKISVKVELTQDLPSVSLETDAAQANSSDDIIKLESLDPDKDVLEILPSGNTSPVNFNRFDKSKNISSEECHPVRLEVLPTSAANQLGHPAMPNDITEQDLVAEKSCPEGHMEYEYLNFDDADRDDSAESDCSSADSVDLDVLEILPLANVSDLRESCDPQQKQPFVEYRTESSELLNSYAEGSYPKDSICTENESTNKGEHTHYKSSTNLPEQQKTANSKEGPFCCPDCGKGFKNKKCLNKHKQGHVTNRPYKCTACQKGFETITNLKRHLIHHMKNEEKEVAFKSSRARRGKRHKVTATRTSPDMSKPDTATPESNIDSASCTADEEEIPSSEVFQEVSGHHCDLESFTSAKSGFENGPKSAEKSSQEVSCSKNVCIDSKENTSDEMALDLNNLGNFKSDNATNQLSSLCEGQGSVTFVIDTDETGAIVVHPVFIKLN